MTDVFVSLLLFAADSAGPRGDNPDSGGGIAIVLVIAGVVLLAGLALAFFFARGRARREAMTRTPAPEGRVGRVSEFRDAE
ncbi:MAG TPA: hypothetical protein VGO83_06400 [Thermoleophilaceae bacterium]|jgi:hypothetical protein|nr:hypothetical protein [Thermoleophilaceae bacterium]